MSESDIIKFFESELAIKGSANRLNLDKHKLNAYRNKDFPKLGTILEILYKAGLVKITTNEPEAGTE
jgi:hypothetical protein